MDGEKTSDIPDTSINFRQTSNNNSANIPIDPNSYYPTTSDQTSHTYLSQSDQDYSSQRNDSYLVPTSQQRTIVGNISDEIVPLIKQNNENQSSIPQVGIKSRAPPPPPTKRDNSGDSYV